jgi:hypothetical protein
MKEFILTRTSNENCYCYGSLEFENDWHCDTLEMGDENCIPDGEYMLQLGLNERNNTKIVQVVDEFKTVIASFVKDNIQTYKNIEMRVANSNICLGCRINTPLLVMYDYVERTLLQLVSEATWTKEGCKLIIKTSEKVIIRR